MMDSRDIADVLIGLLGILLVAAAIWGLFPT